MGFLSIETWTAFHHFETSKVAFIGFQPSCFHSRVTQNFETILLQIAQSKLSKNSLLREIPNEKHANDERLKENMKNLSKIVYEIFIDKTYAKLTSGIHECECIFWNLNRPKWSPNRALQVLKSSHCNEILYVIVVHIRWNRPTVLRECLIIILLVFFINRNIFKETGRIRIFNFFSNKIITASLLMKKKYLHRIK